MNVEGRIVKDFSLKEMANNLTKAIVKLLLTPECVKHAFMMQEFRDWFGKPMTVNSWFRELLFNKSIGGDPNSCHLDGIATDIAFSNLTKEQAELYAEIWRFICIRYGVIGGISIYIKREFIHFDSNNTPTRYGGNSSIFRKQYF